MASDPNRPIPVRSGDAPSFLTPAQWQRVIATFDLCPQQARIVGLVLQGKHDKEIVAAMGLSRDTVRTYLRRVFDRMGVDNRGGVTARVLECVVNHQNKPDVTL